MGGGGGTGPTLKYAPANSIIYPLYYYRFSLFLSDLIHSHIIHTERTAKSAGVTTILCGNPLTINNGRSDGFVSSTEHDVGTYAAKATHD